MVAEFSTGMNMEEALRKVREKVDRARPKLPSDVREPVVMEFNLSEIPIMQVNVSGEYGLVQLKDVAEDVKERLEQISTISEVQISGGLEREVRVEVDLARLKHYGVSYNDIVLPAGPLRVYFTPGARNRLHAKVDLHTLFWTGYGIVDPALEFDAGASLSAGAPVFRAPGRSLIWKHPRAPASGLAMAGVVLLGDFPNSEAIFAHERVHVLQNDQLYHTVAAPFEEWIVDMLPGGPAVRRYVHFNLSQWLLFPVFVNTEYEHRPWEMEARYLVRR